MGNPLHAALVLELVRIEQSDASPLLESGALDIIMSGTAITQQRSSTVQISSPVLDLTAAFVVPDPEVVTPPSPRAYFTEAWQDLDALVSAAEVGSAWTLVYPQFGVAVPQPNPVSVPAGYPMPFGERRLLEFVDAFIDLKASDGTIESLFEHWFEGRGRARHRRRWSVVRNVLGWVN